MAQHIIHAAAGTWHPFVTDVPCAAEEKANWGGDRWILQDPSDLQFTHPIGRNHPMVEGRMPMVAKRSAIQAGELTVQDGKL